MKHFTCLLLALIFLGFYSNLYSEVTDEEINTHLPSLLNLNNESKEYWFTIPPCFEDESQYFPNFIKIFVTSQHKTPVTVSVAATGYNETKTTIPNDVIEFNILPHDGQPFTKSGRDPNMPEQVFKGKGIHVYSEFPIIVYVVVRYKYTSDGFLAIPVASLGKEYIVAGTKVSAMFRAIWNYKLPNITGIVAAFDDTKVRFTLGGNSVTKTAGGMTPGQTKEAILNQGDVWMFSTDADEATLSGSKIVASKPVAVVTGNMCANIPTGNQWCDYIVEMEIPTMSWGYDLLVPTVPGRKNSSPISIFAREPNTKIYKNDRQIGFLPDAGGVEGRAYLEMRMVPLGQKPKPVVISGDKPINIVLFNSGAQEDGYPRPNTGEPFSLNILPVELYQKNVTFCTPGINNGMNFLINYINLIYETDSLGTVTDDLEFAEVINGEFKWTKLNEKFPGNGVVFESKVKNKFYAVKLLTLEGDGVYKIRGEKPFAAYSIGFDDSDSYGYPTSGLFPDLTKLDTVPPKATVFPGDSIIESGQYKGIVTDMPDEDTYRTNLAKIELDVLQSYNFSFSFDPIVPGETRTTNWFLNAVEPDRNARAIIRFYDRRGNLTELNIVRSVKKLASIPEELNFGRHKTGNNNILMQAILSNISDDTVTINANDLIFKNSYFELTSANQFPITLKPSDNLTVMVKPKLLPTGSYIDTLVFNGGLFKNVRVLLARITYLVPQIEVASILDFGQKSIYDDFISYKTLLIKNSSEFDEKIFRFDLPSDNAFSTLISNSDQYGNLNEPYLLMPSTVFDYQVGFKPKEVKIYLDSITVYTESYPNGLKTIIKGEGVLVNSVDNKEEAFVSAYYSNQVLTVIAENIESVSIFDLTGRIIYESGNIFQLNITNIDNLNLSKGLYLIKIKSKGINYYKKLLVL